MPRVGNKHFAYTSKGKAKAKKHAKRTKQSMTYESIYNKVRSFLAESQFRKGGSPRTLPDKDILKRAYDLMAVHKKKAATGVVDQPVLDKAIHGHVKEFLFRKAAKEGTPRPGAEGDRRKPPTRR